MHQFTRFAFAVLPIGLLAGCQSAGLDLPTSPTAAALPPAEDFAHEVGDRETIVYDDGTEVVFEIVEVTETSFSGMGSNGCAYTHRRGTIAGATAWENCNGYTGSAEIEVEGEIFPMEIGKTQTISMQGRSANGDTWEDERTCEVMEAVSVTVPAGTFDTYRVACSGRFATRTYFYAPELRDNVAGDSVHRRDPSRSWSWQLVEAAT